MILLIDMSRNMPVGLFPSTKEALRYAREEGISKMTWEFVKEDK